ncbi:uncharacterized protein PHACADRAFT_32554 [Phanerochaete carnosa HHB-10118-sp]|uniref:Uncharacterized protein n=1 Tax=Phanerochaete carnosa (strain HHB-10118-sp) TaxID=650164 RepID=K5VH26_PHACS|nr:uncharacterized protein PHACADRAFT_32554 [Phanerochaete carnosa HHB-10118-sp]EKM50528.1 hypothetical protein PHACADRAFT_32554 [Phanerochaete carnosa HHB-10118-sp]
MAFASLFSSVQLFLIICCVLEESLELFSIRRSHVLYHFISLVLELAASVLRIPIRCLVCVRLCKRMHMQEFESLAQDITLWLGLWTEEEQCRERTLASLEDELIRERRRNVYNARLQSHFAQAQAEIRQLRAENLRLDTHLRSYQEELATYDAALQQKCQEYDEYERHANEEKTRHLDHLARAQSQNLELQSELEAANARIRELNARLHDNEDRFNRSREQLEKALETSRDQYRLVILAAQRLDNKRTLTIHRLIYIVLLIHGFALHLGERLAPALRSKDSLLARWKVLSAQKVEARRALIRYLHCNVDLQQEFRQLCSRAADVEKEALKYRALYNDSIKSRDVAAKKFKRFYHTITTRYTNNSTRLLTGLLVLWRMNLILTQRLARTEDDQRARALTPLHRHRLVQFVEAAVQCVADEPELVDTGVQSCPEIGVSVSFSDAGVQSSSAARSSERLSARDPVQAPAVTVPSTLKDTSTGSGAFMFCVPSESLILSSSPSKPALRLPADNASTPLRTPSASGKFDRSDLTERVQHLLEKFEALSAMHQSYRDLLLEKTRSTPRETRSKGTDAFLGRAPLLLEQRRSLAASIHAC